MTGPVLVVSNANAGSNEDEDLSAAIEVLRAGGAAVEVVATGGRDDLDAALDGLDSRTLVVAGGDGSLHAVVQALSERGELDEVTIGLIPLGTGNDLARGIELPLDPAEAAATLLDARPRPMDLLIDQEGTVGVNAVNLGIGAAASQRAAAIKGFVGPIAYPLGAVAAGVTEPGWHLTVTVDGDVLVADKVLHIVIGNGPSVGGGTWAAPDADAGDHHVTVVVSLATGALARVGYGRDLRKGRHVDRDDVIEVTGREVVIEGDEHPWNVDGELPPARSRSHWKVMPGAWTMLIGHHPGRAAEDA